MLLQSSYILCLTSSKPSHPPSPLPQCQSGRLADMGIRLLTPAFGPAVLLFDFFSRSDLKSLLGKGRRCEVGG